VINKEPKNSEEYSVFLAIFLPVLFDFFPKICYNFKQIAKRAKKRFYFNVLKNGKKQIIKREVKQNINKSL